jgi:hypothetical protein
MGVSIPLSSQFHGFLKLCNGKQVCAFGDQASGNGYRTMTVGVGFDDGDQTCRDNFCLYFTVIEAQMI